MTCCHFTDQGNAVQPQGRAARHREEAEGAIQAAQSWSDKTSAEHKERRQEEENIKTRNIQRLTNIKQRTSVMTWYDRV